MTSRETSTTATSGSVYTFYSFKGGVGRSMALANIAALLARWGQKVLVLDWDLEAPGIENYFRKWLRRSPKELPGIVDLVQSNASKAPLDWRSCIARVDLPGSQPIDIITAGKDDGEYVARLRSINWETAFAEQRLGNYLEALRREWIAEYSFVLVDSRTGVTDIGGICTIHLPDALIAMFTANEQSLMGVKKILTSARSGHSELSVDRRRLLVVPVPSRDESGSEYKLAEQWRQTFARELSEFFDDWIPKEESPATVLNYLKIPYFSYWSFGERLPVVEQEDPDNPKTLAFAYQPLAKLLLGKLNWREVREGARASEEAQKQAAEAERLRVEALKISEEARKHDAERRVQEAERLRREQEARFNAYVQDRIEDRMRHWRKVAWRELFGVMNTGVFFAASLALGNWTSNDFSYSAWKPLLVDSLLNSAALTIPTILLFLLRRPDRRRAFAIRIVSRLQSELATHRAGGGPYQTVDPGDAFAVFVERTERLLSSAEKVCARWSWKEGLARELEVDAWDHTLSDATLGEDALAMTPRVPRSASSEMLVRKKTSRTHESQAPPRPPTALSRDYEFDVFLSYARSPVMESWIADGFRPLLTFWLEQELGRAPETFMDVTDIAINAELMPQVEHALITSRCLIPIWSPPYFESQYCMRELRSFLWRRSGQIFPVLFHGSPSLPPEVQHLQHVDFTDFSLVGEGFKQTLAYAEFQKRVRDLAASIAVAIRDAPPFDPTAPISEMEQSEKV